MKKTNSTIIKLLLICGILAPINYITADIITSYFYQDYSYFNQTISELSAVGAPTTQIWKNLTLLFSPLVIMYGVGVFLSASKKRSLKISGILILFFGLSGYVWLFYPMNMRGNIGSNTDTGHLILSAITVLLLILFIGFGSGAKAMKFRIYSVISIITILLFGFFVSTMVPQVAENKPTPWIGIYERISVFTPMVWMSILAFILLQKHDKNSKVY